MADYYRLKSLDEMLESIDIGMDVEFYLYNVRYNISWRNNKPFICMCPEGDAIFYDSSEQMFNEYKVNGKALILSILVYTFFTRMFDLMLPLVMKYSIVAA